ncbi:MAG: hypothetical protein OXT65_01130 [Alphaproteobacteria bacterium]|nr:hypothetical protein [Alphaproteobacteria bacterium]
MKLKNWKKMAAVSAIALSVAAYGTGAFAAAVQSGDPNTVNVTATVENTINVTVVDMDFGQIGAMGHGTDTATMTLAPDDTLTDDSDPQASLVADPTSTPAAANITVAAFQNTILYVDYQNIVDLVNGGETLVLDNIVDNLDAPTTGVGGTAGGWTSGGGSSTGDATTDGGGALVFDIGASISTTTAVTGAYTDGAFAGTFEVVVSY